MDRHYSSRRRSEGPRSPRMARPPDGMTKEVGNATKGIPAHSWGGGCLMGLPYPQCYHGRWTNGIEDEHAGWGSSLEEVDDERTFGLGLAGGGYGMGDKIDRSDERKHRGKDKHEAIGAYAEGASFMVGHWLIGRSPRRGKTGLGKGSVWVQPSIG